MITTTATSKRRNCQTGSVLGILLLHQSVLTSAFTPFYTARVPQVTLATSRQQPAFGLHASNEHYGTMLDQLSQTCKGVVASAVMTGTLFFCLPNTLPPAIALDLAIPPTPVVSVESPTSPISTLLEGSEITQRSQTVVGEVWSLINKYYIERTFHGQDWNQVLEKYSSINVADDSEKSLKLVSEMVQTLGDKYTRILDPSQYAAIQKYDLIGIGATLMPNERKEIIVGAPPVLGSASDLAGLRVGDYIDAVNGIPTQGRSAFDIIDQISEQPNAKSVAMTVRTSSGDVKELVMERGFQQVRNPVSYQITERRKDGTVVGFIRIAEFNSLVKARLEDAILKLEKDGANAFVLDLRGNPGGAFQSAVEISSLFVDSRVATYVVDSNHVQLPFRTAGGRVIMPPNQPIAIWVDGGSASASEVLTGSLHDNCRAVVMGSKSFGKGLIQAVYGLKNGAGLVLTVAKYVTPNGTEIQGVGITPDIKGGVPFQPIIGLLPDTSKVDFGDISARLGPEMCTVPYQHPDMKSMN